MTQMINDRDPAILFQVRLAALQAEFGDRVRVVVVRDVSEARDQLGDADLTQMIDGTLDAELADGPLTTDELLRDVRALLECPHKVEVDAPTPGDDLRARVRANILALESGVLEIFDGLAERPRAQARTA